MSQNEWDKRYKKGRTGWDIGKISTPLKEYFDQLKNKSLKILIPGGGNSYEAEYLFQQGFTNIYVADISKYPLDNLKKKVPNFPEDHLLHLDFFDLIGNFDLIVEQTFFCALLPKYRSAYVAQMQQLLQPRGKLIGLYFNFPKTDNGPPFGGNEHEYRALFSDGFTIKVLETAYNSIPPRMGNELFFIFIKKKNGPHSLFN